MPIPWPSPRMLYTIFSFLLEIGVTLVGGACLLRLYMRWRRMSFDNPVGQFVLALSDWLVQPLQRVVPPAGGLDVASLLAAWLLKLVQYALLMALLELPRWGLVPVLALLGTARLAVSVSTALVIIAAVLSWTGQRSRAHDVFERLCAPLLAPIRRRIRLVGGVDLSPLLLIVLLQVLGIVLSSLQSGLLGPGVPALAG